MNRRGRSAGVGGTDPSTPERVGPAQTAALLTRPFVFPGWSQRGAVRV
jgi:hypothetical protein